MKATIQIPEGYSRIKRGGMEDGDLYFNGDTREWVRYNNEGPITLAIKPGWLVIRRIKAAKPTKSKKRVQEERKP